MRDSDDRVAAQVRRLLPRHGRHQGHWGQEGAAHPLWLCSARALVTALLPAAQGKYYSVNFPMAAGIDDKSYQRVFEPVRPHDSAAASMELN